MSTIQENYELLNLNTFKVSATARYFIEIKDNTSLDDLLQSDIIKNQQIYILGGGSNILFTKDFEGLVIWPLITGIEKTGEGKDTVTVKAGAGETWDQLVEYCVNRNWGGLENLSLIPGTVGASPVQNIGAYGTEVKDCIERVEGRLIATGEPVNYSARECNFSYRNSIFKNELKNKVIITHVYFRLHRNPHFQTGYPDLAKEIASGEISVKSIRQAIIKIRTNKLPDPEVTGNAGSFFKNPIVSADKASGLQNNYPEIPVYKLSDGSCKIPAAWLIEKAGWKGKSTGNVGTHPKQPLIIINLGGATGSEIYEFAAQIQKAVFEMFGVGLEMEVNVI